jgi:hypothetical protein
MKIDSLSFLAISAIIASLVTVTVFFWQRWLTKRRLLRFQNLTLVPNVLLTRHPILFISRSRSLFRMGGDFFELPIFLREHGYQVEEIEVQNKNLSENETTLLIRQLLSAPTLSLAKTHLVLSESFSESAQELAFEGHDKLQSLTVLGTEQSRAIRLRPPRVPFYPRPDLKPSSTANNFHIELSALKHFVSLAESDLR